MLTYVFIKVETFDLNSADSLIIWYIKDCIEFQSS